MGGKGRCSRRERTSRAPRTRPRRDRPPAQPPPHRRAPRRTCRRRWSSWLLSDSWTWPQRSGLIARRRRRRAARGATTCPLNPPNQKKTSRRRRRRRRSAPQATFSLASRVTQANRRRQVRALLRVTEETEEGSSGVRLLASVQLAHLRLSADQHIISNCPLRNHRSSHATHDVTIVSREQGRPRAHILSTLHSPLCRRLCTLSSFSWHHTP